MSGKHNLSAVTLILGTIVSLGSAAAAYFYADSLAVLAGLLIGMIGAAITVSLDQRLKLGEIERMISEANTVASITTEIQRLARSDEIFQIKYSELAGEISDLARGTYRIRTLTSLYQDDIRSIGKLRSGEILLSTCPVTPASTAAAANQLSAPAYKESMRAHLEAAGRGVLVTRIYLMPNRDFLFHEPIWQHMTEIEATKMQVGIILRDEIILDGQFDFLVFGPNKVSVGVAEPGAGSVSGAIVYTDPSTVRRYVEEYGKLRVMSAKPSAIKTSVKRSLES